MQITALVLALGALAPTDPAQEPDPVRVEAVERRLDELTGESSRLQAQIEVYTERLARLAPTLATRREAELGPNPAHLALRERLAELEIEFVALIDGILPPNTLKQRRETMEAEIEQVRARLQETAAQVEVLPARTDVQPNPEVHDLRARLTDLEAALSGVRGERRAYERLLAELRARAGEQPAQDDLARRVAALEVRVAALEGGGAPGSKEEATARYAAARERAADARRALVQAEERLLDHRRKTGVLDVEDRLAGRIDNRNQLDARLEQYQRELDQMAPAISATLEEIEALDDQVEQVVATEGERRVVTFVPNEAKVAARSNLAALEHRHATLVDNLTAGRRLRAERHQEVQSLFGVAATRRALERAVADAERRDARAFEALLDAEDAFNR